MLVGAKSEGRPQQVALFYFIILAARLPISSAKLVPRSHGQTWLIEAKYNPSIGVSIARIFRVNL